MNMKRNALSEEQRLGSIKEQRRQERIKTVRRQRILLAIILGAAIVIGLLITRSIFNPSSNIQPSGSEARSGISAASRSSNEANTSGKAGSSGASTAKTSSNIVVPDSLLEDKKEKPAETKAPTPTPTPVPTDDGTGTTVKLCMVGDVLLSSAINDTSYTGYGYDFSCLFENIAPRLAEYDLKIVNEETACGGEAFGISGYPSFNSPHEAIDAMAGAGFNLVCLATNHMLDHGPDPLFETLNYWRASYPGVSLIGAYDSQEAADQIYVYEKEGFRISVLNYTYGSNSGSGSYYDCPFALNLIDEEKIYSDIQKAKAMSDYVIVCPHWGTEYNTGIDDSQNHLASLLCEWEVDLVLGTHPHVIEPIEVRTKENGHETIIYYSLGNFVSNQDNAFSLVGGFADITLRKNDSGVHVDDFGVIPLVTQKAGRYTSYFINDYNDDLTYAGINAVIDPEFSYQYCIDLANSVFGDRIRS